MPEAETGTGEAGQKMTNAEKGRKGAEARKRNAELKRKQETGTGPGPGPGTGGQQTQQPQNKRGKGGSAGGGKGVTAGLLPMTGAGQQYGIGWQHGFEAAQLAFQRSTTAA